MKFRIFFLQLKIKLLQISLIFFIIHIDVFVYVLFAAGGATVGTAFAFAAAAAGSLLFGQVQVVDGRQVAGAAAALCTAALGAQAADHVVCLAADKERLAAASALFLRFTWWTSKLKLKSLCFALEIAAKFLNWKITWGTNKCTCDSIT